MRRLVYLDDARDNLRDIYRYILRESGNRKSATAFVKQLTEQCDRIARFESLLGRRRDDLAPGLRSLVYKAYVIFFIYGDEAVEIVNILHGRRDLEGFFERKNWEIPE